MKALDPDVSGASRAAASLRGAGAAPRRPRAAALLPSPVQVHEREIRSRLGGIRAAGLLETRSYIGGEWRDAAVRTAVRDPATGRALIEASFCDASSIDAAIDCAASAQAGWSERLPAERGGALRRWAAAMRAHRAPLADLVTLEQGKPTAEATAEIDYAADFMDWFAGEAERLYGETFPSHKPGSRTTVDLQPVGVAGIVTPWNFPSAMIARKAAAALAAGCSVVAKPAADTPLSALALARLAEHAGIPPGVFNVVHGEPVALTNRLLADERVRAFSFTGSTDTGRLLLGKAATSVKRVSMELGGHAPFIAYDDCALDDAVRGCMAAKFATSGQDCLAVNRVYVQRPIYDAFCERLAAATARLTIGHGLAPDIRIGPMTNRPVADKCRSHIRDALDKGARCLAGGQTDESAGNFVIPTLLADADDSMRIAREETFGPVLAVMPFDTEDEALARANGTEMGLAAYAYTRSLARAARASRRLQFGMVAINTPSFTGPPVPFGGWKQSGLGREGSRHGVSEFLELKYTCIGGLAN